LGVRGCDGAAAAGHESVVEDDQPGIGSGGQLEDAQGISDPVECDVRPPEARDDGIEVAPKWLRRESVSDGEVGGARIVLLTSDTKN
jgi:hypothetical protein